VKGGKKVNKDDTFLSCNEGDKINNCKLNSELFSNYFLTTAEQITTSLIIIIK